jgi:hypothetical protein
MAKSYKPGIFAPNLLSQSLTNWPGMRSFNNLNIGLKLNIGFGILVLLTFLGVGLTYIASQEATLNINLTEAVRVPARDRVREQRGARARLPGAE